MQAESRGRKRRPSVCLSDTGMKAMRSSPFLWALFLLWLKSAMPDGHKMAKRQIHFPGPVSQESPAPIGGQGGPGSFFGGFAPAHQGLQRPPPPPPPPPAVFQGNNEGCNCVPHVSCAGAPSDRITQGCQLPTGAGGICCVSGQSPSGSLPGGGNFLINKKPLDEMPQLPLKSINEACDVGLQALRSLNNIENQLLSANLVVRRRTPESGHLRFFKVTDSAMKKHEEALAIALASKEMSGTRVRRNALRGTSVENSKLSEFCPRTPSCRPPRKYREIDGSCNNPREPLWGKSETALQRIVNPTYRDGIMSPRTHGVSGNELRSEREISSTVLIDINQEDRDFTLSLMQWGQFIDHDLSHVPFPNINGEGIECCQNGQIRVPPPHEMCWPIQIPSNDLFFSSRRHFCMNFVRSMFSMGSRCLFGYAEQMNQITHWLDGSNIYGSNAQENGRLRLRRDGLLQVTSGNLLPFDPVSGGDCEARQRNSLCYIAGDSRVNEQPGLTAIHAIWHREHNRVATQLKAMHPNWNDQQVFEEARRIVVAEMQHIIYNEWLPIILGENYLNSYRIEVSRQDFNFDYNPNINPNINNEFAAAAFRFGHTLVQGAFRLISSTGAVSTLQLRDHFNSPHIFQQNANILDQFARSLVQQPIQMFDSFVTEDLTNHLFQTPEFNFGMDLMSLNIHRGRDHAIGTYNDLRNICGLPRATTFEQFLDHIPSETLSRIRQVYDHPDDVDLWTGGISERPIRGGLLGYTFTCIVGDQFVRAKKGDRFFYDLGGQPSSFQQQQLLELKKASWARILCDNTNIGFVQPLAFRLPSPFNQQVDCNSPTIQRVNLGLWRFESPAV